MLHRLLIQKILRKYSDKCHTYILSGDSGYPLRSWLLTPLENEPPENTPEHRYNMVHKNTIERCNGLLKLRFRCLLKHHVLHYKPHVACKIISSCIVLHNMCVTHNVELPDEIEDQIDYGIIPRNYDNGDEINENPLVRRVYPELAEGRRRRNQIIHTIFRNRN